MMSSTLRVATGAVLALVLATGLGACSGSSDAPASGAASSTSSTSTEDAGTHADLEAARQTILSTLEERGELPEIYLASDVKKPEEKYGMLVVPYVHSEATEKLTTSIVKIDGGNFTIGAISAATGTEWQIDQDGNISEAAK